MPLLRIVATFALALSVTPPAAGPPQPNAQRADRLEYDVKAAYIFNLLPFTTWPASAFTSATAPFTICIAPPNPFGRTLNRTFEHEHVGSHPVVVAVVTTTTAIHECHVLFIGADADRDGSLEQAAANGPVLTIGETPRFQERGGMITFVVGKGRVRFDVSQAPAARSNLQFSSKILQVARRVS